MIKCQECSLQNLEDSKFCSRCGSALEVSPAYPPPPIVTEDRRTTAKCASCGSENPSGSAFCSACGWSLGTEIGGGAGSSDSVRKDSGRPAGKVIAVVAVVAIIIIALVALNLNSPSSSTRTPYTPSTPLPTYYTLTGTLKVHVENNAWLTTYHYSIYVDNVLKISNDEIGPFSDETWSFTHTWQSTSPTGSDYVTVKFAWGSSSGTVYQTKSAYVPASGIANVYFTVG